MIIRIGVKYCGGCNTAIDRSAMLRELEKKLPAGFELTTDLDGAPCMIGIFVCGCRVGCADRPDIRCLVPHWIVVAGESVDLDSVSESNLAEMILRKINKIAGSSE